MKSGKHNTDHLNQQDFYTTFNIYGNEYYDHKRPPYTYAQIIVQALLNHPLKRATLGEIYVWISNTYPFYKMSNKGWLNSVRHNLSIYSYFHRTNGFNEEDRAISKKKKSNFWYIDPKYFFSLISTAYTIKKARSRKKSNLSCNRRSRKQKIFINDSCFENTVNDNNYIEKSVVSTVQYSVITEQNINKSNNASPKSKALVCNPCDVNQQLSLEKTFPVHCLDVSPQGISNPKIEELHESTDEKLFSKSNSASEVMISSEEQPLNCDSDNTVIPNSKTANILMEDLNERVSSVSAYQINASFQYKDRCIFNLFGEKPRAFIEQMVSNYHLYCPELKLKNNYNAQTYFYQQYKKMCESKYFAGSVRFQGLQHSPNQTKI